MDDLVDRLRRAKNMTLRVGALCRMADQAAARIEALEARIAKADALAEVAERAIKLSQDHDSFKLHAMEPMWQSLAAYREGADT